MTTIAQLFTALLYGLVFSIFTFIIVFMLIITIGFMRIFLDDWKKRTQIMKAEKELIDSITRRDK